MLKISRQIVLAHQDRNFKFLFNKSVKPGGMVFYILNFVFFCEVTTESTILFAFNCVTYRHCERLQGAKQSHGWHSFERLLRRPPEADSSQ